MPHISVIIPVYKAEGCLHELYIRLKTSLATITDDFEIIMIEDCGGDRSWEIIKELSGKDGRVKGVKLTRNFGQHAATICGFSQAQGSWIITIDDDLEQNPEDIPMLYEKALQGYELVYAIYPQRAHSKWRNLTSETVRRLFRWAISNLNYEYTSFRIIKNEIARVLCQFESPFPFVDGYLSWVTNNYATVEVEHSARAHGVSNYSFRRLLTHTINIFVTFSDTPLKFASWVGLCSFIVGMIWMSVIISGKLLGTITVSGFASLMAGIVLFGGLQMLVLGILGEYIGRINFKSSRKPLFLIREKTFK